jgi:MbtH protein
MDEDEDNTLYRVVVNHEEQYSIWPLERDLPAGWRDAGKEGRKDQCLAFINEHWTDMRPLSLRKQMAAASKRAAAQGRKAGPAAEQQPGT